MELHTLGVDGGYTQADVTQLARILTGWSVDEDGAFRLRELTHEPGPKVLLGRTYPEAGVDEGEAALVALARHPSTARHVATRLARHFAADDPPPALVDDWPPVSSPPMATCRRSTAPWSKSPSPGSSRPPKSASRTSTCSPPSAPSTARPRSATSCATFGAMGQPPFAAPSPQGWRDHAADWISPPP